MKRLSPLYPLLTRLLICGSVLFSVPTYAASEAAAAALLPSAAQDNASSDSSNASEDKPAKKKAKPTPVTMEDLEIPSDELKLMVKPMSTPELKIEAEGWFKALHQKAKEVVDFELKIKRLNKNQTAIDEQMALAEAQPQEGEHKSELSPEEILSKGQTLLSALSPNAPPVDSLQALNSALQSGSETLAKEKDLLTEQAAAVREQRTSLIDRLNVVLNAVNAKEGIKEDGTDNDIVVPYRRYISTVTGLNVDLTDAESTLKMAKKWVTSKEGGQRWLKNIALFLAILFGFWLLSGILSLLLKKALKAANNSSILLRNFLVRIVRKATMLIGIVMALGALEVNISPLLAALGAAGFILAFALQGTISNFASGILMMIYRPFDIGDSIEAGGISGKVESMSLVSTQVKTADNQRMVVPNNSVWGGSITNSSNTNRRRVDMTFTVSKKDNAADVRALLEEIVDKHPKVLQDPTPTIRLDELTDSAMKFAVRPWCLTGDYSDVKWDVTLAVKELFDNDKITSA